MTDEVIISTSTKFVEGLIEDWSSFTPATRALDDLTPDQAVTKLEGWPHSIRRGGRPHAVLAAARSPNH